MRRSTSTACTCPEPVRAVAAPLHPSIPLEPDVHHRQTQIPGFDQAALAAATVDVVGLGAGSEIARVLAKKGVGRLRLYDPDPGVELSNLPRQFYSREQLYRPKAAALPTNLAREATGGATVEGYALGFEAAVAAGCDVACDVAVVAVDANPTRAFCSRHFRERGIPALFTGFSADADRAYVFVQDPTGACWGCLFPDEAVDDTRFPCAAATLDLPAVVGGLIAYAVDSLLMGRPRAWTYREVSLSGVTPDHAGRVARRADCPLCGATAPAA